MTHWVMVDANGAIVGISPSPYNAPLPPGCEPPRIPKGCSIYQVPDKPGGPMLWDPKNKCLVVDVAKAKTAELDMLTEKKAAAAVAMAELDKQIADCLQSAK